MESIYVPESCEMCNEVIDKYGEESDIYLVHQGRLVPSDAFLRPGELYRICYRLRGGKGGFGSMLRTIGAQIEKTTNREAMRDLSGRRLRDVNNERRLADWVAGAAQREREQEERRQERLERRRAEIEGKGYKFKDEKYMEQKEKVADNLDDALTQGLKRAAASTSAGSSSEPVSKKGKGKAAKALPAASSWLGVDIDPDLLSSSDEEGDQDTRVESHVLPEDPELKRSMSATETEGACSIVNNTTEAVGETAAVREIAPSEKSAEAESTEDSSRDSAEQRSSADQAEEVLEPIDLETHSSAEELEEYGLDRLKAELIRRGLKCGGSLTQRAQRLFSVKGLSQEEIDPSLLAKASK